MDGWLLEKLRCPVCGGDGLEPTRSGSDLVCPSCHATYPVDDQMLDLLPPGKRRLRLLEGGLMGTKGAAFYEHFRTSRLAAAVAGRSFNDEKAKINDYLAPLPNDAILDVACGPGNFTRGIALALGSGHLVGLDLSRAMLARAGSNLRGLEACVDLVRGDVQEMPFRNESFNKINCSGGLHLFPEPDAAISEIARVLVPGGTFSGITFIRGVGLLPSWVQGMGRRTLGVRFEPLEKLAERLAQGGLFMSRGEVSGWMAIFKAEKGKEEGRS